MHEIKYVLCTTMVCADSRKSQHREHVNFYEIQVHSWSDLISIPTFWNRFASFHCFNKWFIDISHSRSEQFLKQNTISSNPERTRKFKPSTTLLAMMFEKAKQGNNRVSINGRFMANDSAEKQTVCSTAQLWVLTCMHRISWKNLYAWSRPVHTVIYYWGSDSENSRSRIKEIEICFQ